MGLVIGVIATGWTLAGVWIVLPFAGLETGLLAYLFYRVSRDTYQQQIIEITPTCIELLQGQQQHLVVRFPKEDCIVDITDTDNDWHPPRFRLVSQRLSYEIGQFLSLVDRKELKIALEQAGLVICRRHWWKS